MKCSTFLDQVRDEMRSNHLSNNTQKCYIAWIYRFMIFHNKSPNVMGGKEIGEFLSDLSVHRKSSVSSQNQALNALVFLYTKVVKIKLADFSFKASGKKKQSPVVLDRNEVLRILENLNGEFHLMAALIYGCGLRLNECLGLRVKDINFELNEIIVQDAKGEKIRKTLLPEFLISHLKIQIEKTKIKFEENLLISGFAGASIPKHFELTFPNAHFDLAWQYLFPSRNLSFDLGIEKLKQHSHHASYLQKAVKVAIRKANINKNASCQSLRHSFATHLLEDGYDIRTVQELLGHKDMHSTMVYRHMCKRKRFNVRSPLDILSGL